MTDQPPPVAGAVRLIFEYEGDTVRLVYQEPVDVATPRFHDRQRADHFVETRNDAGACSRGSGSEAASPERQVFPEDHEPGDHPDRHPGERPASPSDRVGSRRCAGCGNEGRPIEAARPSRLAPPPQSRRAWSSATSELEQRR